MDETIGVLCIVVFVVYPFAMAGLARSVSSRTGSRRYHDLLAKVFFRVGLIPALLLIIVAPEAKIPSVCIVAALIVVFCFRATGAVIGALLDRQQTSAPSGRLAGMTRVIEACPRCGAGSATLQPQGVEYKYDCKALVETLHRFKCSACGDLIEIRVPAEGAAPEAAQVAAAASNPPRKGRFARVLIGAVICGALAVYVAGYLLGCHVSWAHGPGSGRLVRRYHWRWKIPLYAPAAKIEAAARELEVWVGPRDSNEGGQWHDPLGVGRWKAAFRRLPVPPDAPPETRNQYDFPGYRLDGLKDRSSSKSSGDGR